MTVEKIRSQLAEDPRVFQKAIRYWGNRTLEKAVRRAREKGRPMDPWNFYDGPFITTRLDQEIKEWQEAKTWVEELDELKDIVALATSRAMWILHQNGAFMLNIERREGANTSE